MSIVYKIVGVLKGVKEVLDSTDSKSDAEYLLREYRIAFSNEWDITIKEVK